MFLRDLISQTKSILPLFTDEFTENISISTLSKTGDDVSITTSTDHGLAISDQVLISGVKTDILISSISTTIAISTVTQLNGLVTITTTSNHYIVKGDRVTITDADQTQYNGNFPIKSSTDTTFTYRINANPVSPATGSILGSIQNKAVAICSVDHDLTLNFTINADITSAEPAYDGLSLILSVPTSLVFTLEVAGSPSDSTGSLHTFHNFGFNGVQLVSAVNSTTEFEYVLEDDRLTAGSGTNMLAMKNPRITGAANLSRAVEMYTRFPTNDLWGFFVFEDMTTSDDRTVNNDSKNERVNSGEDFKLRLINNVTFYLFIPTHEEISGRTAIDLAQELARPIYKTLARFVPEIVFTTDQQTILMPAGHSPEIEDSINPAVLVYGFEFQGTEFMLSTGEADPGEFMSNTGDTLPNFTTRAFRKFNWKLDNEFDEIVKDDNYDIEE